MTPLDLSSMVRRDPEMISADMDGETVMLSIEDGKYYGLVGIGPNLWDWLEEPISIGALCQKVINTFDVDEETCRTDVLALLTDLHSRNIVLLV